MEKKSQTAQHNMHNSLKGNSDKTFSWNIHKFPDKNKKWISQKPFIMISERCQYIKMQSQRRIIIAMATIIIQTKM